MVQSEKNIVRYTRIHGKQEINIVLRFSESPDHKAKTDLIERLKELYLRKTEMEMIQHGDTSHE